MDLSGYKTCIVISSTYYAKAWERYVPDTSIYRGATELTHIMNDLREVANRVPKNQRHPVALILDPLLRLNVPYIRDRVRYTDAVVMVLEPEEVATGMIKPN